MRKVKEMQMKLGEVTIADITFDLRSRVGKGDVHKIISLHWEGVLVSFIHATENAE